MTITNLSVLNYEQITYLHDGDESADAHNRNQTRSDAMLTYVPIDLITGEAVTDMI